MYSYKTEAVILRWRDFGEADRIITFYTKSFGKMDAVAKAARRPSSKYGSSLEPLTHINLMFYHRNIERLAIVTGFDIISSNSYLRSGIDLYMHGAYISEIMIRFHEEREENLKTFMMLLKTFSVLGTKDPELVKMAFVLKFLAFSGYRLNIHKCVSCKTFLPFAKISFNIQQGGIVCPKCRIIQKNAFDISLLALEGLKKLEQTKLDELEKIVLSGTTKEEIKSILNVCLNFHLGSELKTERFKRSLSKDMLEQAVCLS